MTIKVLETRKTRIREDALELVENLLEKVKAGEVVSVAFIAVTEDGGVAVAHSTTDYYHQIIAGTVYLQNSMSSRD